MKILLFILVQLFVVLSLNARSFPKDTLRGKNASYEREFIFSAIRMRNIQNKDTTHLMYFDDGKQVSEEYWAKSNPKFDFEYPILIIS